MAEDDKKLEAKVKVLKKEISEIKSDVRELKKILSSVDAAEGKASDEKELEGIHQLIEAL